MSESFKDILSRHLNRFSARMTGGVQSTASTLDTQNTEIAANEVSPTQIMAIIQGDSAFLKQFEQSVEESFSKLGDRVLQNWMQNVDSEMRRGISDVIKTMGDFAGDASQILQEGGNLAEAFAKSSGSFGNALGNLAGGILQSALTRTQTTIQESARSQEATSQFRDSRGQTQADLSEQMARGRRYQ